MKMTMMMAIVALGLGFSGGQASACDHAKNGKTCEHSKCDHGKQAKGKKACGCEDGKKCEADATKKSETKS